MASGTGFVEGNFSTDQGWRGGGWFLDDSRALHLLIAATDLTESGAQEECEPCRAVCKYR